MPQHPVLKMSDPGLPDRRDAIFRMIQWVMLGDIAIGLALAGIGYFVLQEPSFIIVGLGLAGIGAVMTLVFRQLANRSGSAER